MLRHTRTSGQAVVEFALAATLIFFLLAAAVDVGLIFFEVQALHNAAQEGAAYGSRWLVTNASNQRVLDTTKITDRVRGESGSRGGNGFINLYDLDDNGVDDRTQNGSASDPNIVIDMLADPSNDGDPTLNVSTGATENTACTDASITTTPCYIRVTVKSSHKMLFGFAPVFGKVVPLKSSYIMPLRDSIARGTGTGSTTQIQVCTVPDFYNTNKSAASNTWTGAKWTGTISYAGGSWSVIKTQSKAAGSTDDCRNGITLGP